MKWIKYLFYFLISIYLILCAVLYFGQERILFFPDRLPDSYVPKLGEEVWIKVEEDVKLHAALIKTPNPKGAILYLHGNKGNVRRCIYQSETFQNLGYDILIPDYRSFGKSEGSLENENQMYQDAQKLYNHLQTQYDKILVIGYSMGSGLASYLAANNKVESLVLIAPYVSLVDMKNRFIPFVPNFLMKYHFHTDENLKKVSCPVALIHGERDEVIPYDSSVKLHKLFPKTTLIGLQGVGHRRVIFNGAIRGVIKN